MKSRRSQNISNKMIIRIYLALSLLVVTLFISIYSSAIAQESTVDKTLKRPKLVVGIVVDQMHWDYLYRYYDRYTEHGFKRLLSEGFSCNNTLIDHVPTATAVGHATVYTGSVPAIHGIVGNEWVDQLTERGWYCTEDTTVNAVGGSSQARKMSPRNLLTTTIGDELRFAQNFRSKVVGISLKDRAAIIPAGHAATAAFWFDEKEGNFVTSSYYMEELPAWLQAYNTEKRGQKLVANNWNTLYPIETYLQCSEDNVPWEGMLSGATAPVFPYELASVYNRKPDVIRATPFGNSLIQDFAKEAIIAYQLGKESTTDFLAINFASTDFVGHMYGINSIEIEDTYLRLDQNLANLFQFLDEEIGNEEYVVFLTADHGAAPSKDFMDKHDFPTGYWGVDLEIKLNTLLKERTSVSDVVREDGKIGANYQVNFDQKIIEQNNLDFNQIKDITIDFLLRQEGIMYAIDMEKIAQASVIERIKTSTINSYNFKRSGSIQIVPDSGWMPNYSQTGTTHGSWNPYDAHIPLLFMGMGIQRGSTNKRTSMIDIAPTLAALLKIAFPSGSVGEPIMELIK